MAWYWHLYILLIRKRSRSASLIASIKLSVSSFSSYTALPSTLFFFFVVFFTAFSLFLNPLTVAYPTFHFVKSVAYDCKRHATNFLKLNCGDRQIVGSKLWSSLWFLSAIRSSKLAINAFITRIPIGIPIVLWYHDSLSSLGTLLLNRFQHFAIHGTDGLIPTEATISTENWNKSLNSSVMLLFIFSRSLRTWSIIWYARYISWFIFWSFVTRDCKGAATR